MATKKLGAPQRKQHRHFFRITMLPSWAKPLSDLTLPNGWQRIGVSSSARTNGTECHMVLLIERSVTKDDVSKQVRSLLGDFEGWMKVEPMKQEEGEALC